MTQNTHHLDLPYILASQAQKHVTHNEALRALDAIVQLGVRSRTLADQPVAPAEGERHIRPGEASGPDWGPAAPGAVLSFVDGAWQALRPAAGWLAFVEDEDALLLFDGADWRPVPLPFPERVPRLGVGAAPDAVNRFAATLNAALWNGLARADGGTGDLRYVMNKEGRANVLSLLLQSGFSARAEIGLVGDDDLVLRVSPDGAAFLEALRVDRASGAVRFPAGGVREQLTGPRTLHVDPAGSDLNTGRAPGAAGALRTIARALALAQALDLGVHDLVVDCAPGTYGEALVVSGAFVGTGRVILRGEIADPSLCTIATSGNPLFVSDGAILRVEGFTLASSGSGSCLYATRNGRATITGPMILGSAGRAHLRVEDPGSQINVDADYIVSGNAPRHLEVVRGARLVLHDRAVTLQGERTFATGFAICNEQASLQYSAARFTGTARGRRYRVSTQGLIVTYAGEGYFPGDVVGIAETLGLLA